MMMVALLNFTENKTENEYQKIKSWLNKAQRSILFNSLNDDCLLLILLLIFNAMINALSQFLNPLGPGRLVSFDDKIIDFIS